MSVKKHYYEIAEPLSWQVIYDDDTTVNEVEGESKNKFYNLDFNRIKSFRLLNENNEAIAQWSGTPDPSKKYFFRMRNKLGLSNRSIERHYMLGWRTAGGDVRFWILYPDGTVEHHTKFTNNALLSEPHWHPNEAI